MGPGSRTDGAEMVALVRVLEREEVISRVVARHSGRQLRDAQVVRQLQVDCFLVQVEALRQFTQSQATGPVELAMSTQHKIRSFQRCFPRQSISLETDHSTRLECR